MPDTNASDVRSRRAIGYAVASRREQLAAPLKRLVPLSVAGKQVKIVAGELDFLRKIRTWSPERLARGDIAEMNMVCAIELPGSEDLYVSKMLTVLDKWATCIRQVTDANYHRFRANPSEFDHSEPYWRILILTTVLQQHYGIKYDRGKIENMNWCDTRDLFIHGLLGPQRSGTCPSLPVLIAALGRRLGYPIRLVLAPGHVFSRWDDPQDDPQAGVRFNIECHGNGLVVHPDEYYHHSPVEWLPELHAEEERLGPNRVFLRSLRPGLELGQLSTFDALGRQSQFAPNRTEVANVDQSSGTEGCRRTKTANASGSSRARLRFVRQADHEVGKRDRRGTSAHRDAHIAGAHASWSHAGDGGAMERLVHLGVRQLGRQSKCPRASALDATGSGIALGWPIRAKQGMRGGQDMTTPSYPTEQVVAFHLANSRNNALGFYLEPWGDHFRIGPGETLDVRAWGPEGDCLTVEVTEQGMTVTGWPGSLISVHKNGVQLTKMHGTPPAE